MDLVFINIRSRVVMVSRVDMVSRLDMVSRVDMVNRATDKAILNSSTVVILSNTLPKAMDHLRAMEEDINSDLRNRASVLVGLRL